MTHPSNEVADEAVLRRQDDEEHINYAREQLGRFLGWYVDLEDKNNPPLYMLVDSIRACTVNELRDLRRHSQDERTKAYDVFSAMREYLGRTGADDERMEGMGIVEKMVTAANRKKEEMREAEEILRGVRFEENFTPNELASGLVDLAKDARDEILALRQIDVGLKEAVRVTMNENKRLEKLLEEEKSRVEKELILRRDATSSRIRLEGDVGRIRGEIEEKRREWAKAQSKVEELEARVEAQKEAIKRLVEAQEEGK